jgi:hypothetical protein
MQPGFDAGAVCVDDEVYTFLFALEAMFFTTRGSAVAQDYDEYWLDVQLFYLFAKDRFGCMCLYHTHFSPPTSTHSLQGNDFPEVPTLELRGGG